MATRQQYDKARRHLQEALDALVCADELFRDDDTADPDVRSGIFDAQDGALQARRAIDAVSPQ